MQVLKDFRKSTKSCGGNQGNENEECVEIGLMLV